MPSRERVGRGGGRGPCVNTLFLESFEKEPQSHHVNQSHVVNLSLEKNCLTRRVTGGPQGEL